MCWPRDATLHFNAACCVHIIPAQGRHVFVVQVMLLLQFLATPAGAAAVNATLAIPQADRAAIIGLPGLVDATQARRTCTIFSNAE